METLGQHLREERQKQGKTLEQIAERTRISRTVLQAIEDDQYEQLPPASYLRGFLKLYAHELDLNIEELLALLPTRTTGQNSLALPKAPDLETPKKPLIKIFFIVGLLCIACIWAWQFFFGLAPVNQEIPAKIVSPRPALPESFPGPAKTPAPAEDTLDRDETVTEPLPKAKAVPEKLSKPAPKPAKKPQPETSPPMAFENFTVKFIARGIVWIKLQADNEKTIDITLRNGEQYRISAKQMLTVRLGNPALVDVFYNDTSLDLPGKEGVPLDMIFPDFARQSPVTTD